MEEERTLILLKPHSLKQNLAGEILSRFEKAGLKINAMKMIQADKELAKKHYQLDEEWAQQIYNKTKKAYEKAGKEVDFKTPLEIGERIQGWNMSMLQEGPTIALILEGENAIAQARKIAGATEPKSAEPGTIRGDFASSESYILADKEQRVLRNLVHASDTPENALREISLWFPDELTETIYPVATETSQVQRTAWKQI